MDPITVAIVAAIAAGVTSGVTDVSKKAVADSYDALKSAIKRKFGDDSSVVQAVTSLEKEPNFEPNQAALAGRVDQVKAVADPELQELAQALQKVLEGTPEGKKALGKYQIDASNAQIGVIGDGTKVDGGLHFGATKPNNE